MNTTNIAEDEKLINKCDNNEYSAFIVTASDTLQPAFSENNIAILLCANDKYAPYLSVVIQSILDNSSVEYNYDIIVFTRDITIANQQIIQEQCKQNINFSVRFYDVSKQMQEYLDLYIGLDGHLSLETYYRLLAPYILTDFNKVLYLDCDIIIKHNIAKLFYTDLETGNYVLAACHDPCLILSYRYNLDNLRVNLGKTFPIDFNTDNYFQAGILVLNLAAFRRDFSVQSIFNIAKSKKWTHHDQDVLNLLALNRVYVLNMKWNVIADWLTLSYKLDKKGNLKKDQSGILEEYNTVRQNPYIIHYAASNEKKPWNDSNGDFADIWWSYAVKTPYAKILQENLEQTQKERKKFKNRLKRFMKKILMPIVNIFFPKGSDRRENLKERYYKKKK